MPSDSGVASAARTVEDYADRVERVHAYLAEHLDRDVDLDHLAGIACFSPFHFHRIYHALQGETVAESVRRMRLHRAARPPWSLSRYPLDTGAALRESADW